MLLNQLFYVNLLKWTLPYVPRGLTFMNSTFFPHSAFICFVWVSEVTAIISLSIINWLVFITETEDVYCAVRAGSLNKTYYASSLNVKSPTLFTWLITTLCDASLIVHNHGWQQRSFCFCVCRPTQAMPNKGKTWTSICLIMAMPWGQYYRH